MSGRGKLALKGGENTGKNLSYQRNVPTFLKQYQHLLGNNKQNYEKQDHDDFRSIKDILATGAQVVNLEHNGDEQQERNGEGGKGRDEEAEEVQALYKASESVSKLSRANVVPMSADDAFEISKPHETFDPSSKIVFMKKRKIETAETENPTQPVSSSVHSLETVGRKNEKKGTVKRPILSFNEDEF